MPNQQNFSMPGPNFGNDNGANWFKQNLNKTAACLVIALIVVGTAYFYNSYQTRIDTLKPILEEITASPSPSTIAQSQQNTVKGTTSSIPEVKKESDKIIATAAKGNGATHLARQALKEYLQDKPELSQNLEPEHRVFIEDYLRKNIGQPVKNLKVGDQLIFSDNDIQSAIDKALALNDGQIKNLGKYVPLVPSLMTS